MTRLLDVPEAVQLRLHAELAAGGSPELPGAVRASIGIGTTEADIDCLVGALHEAVQTHQPQGAIHGR